MPGMLIWSLLVFGFIMKERGLALVLSKVCPIMYEKYSDCAYVQVSCTEAYGMSPQALQDDL